MIEQCEVPIESLPETTGCKELRRKIFEKYGASYYRLFLLDLQAELTQKAGEFTASIVLPDGLEGRKDILWYILYKEVRKFTIVVRKENDGDNPRNQADAD